MNSKEKVYKKVCELKPKITLNKVFRRMNSVPINNNEFNVIVMEEIMWYEYTGHCIMIRL